MVIYVLLLILGITGAAMSGLLLANGSHWVGMVVLIQSIVVNRFAINGLLDA